MIKEKRYTDYIERQKDIVEDLKIEISDFKAKYDDRERDTKILQNLYSNGYIMQMEIPLKGDHNNFIYC